LNSTALSHFILDDIGIMHYYMFLRPAIRRTREQVDEVHDKFCNQDEN